MILKLVLNYEYNLNKKLKILIVFDEMIDNMLSNKKLQPIERVLFIRSRKLSKVFVFITCSPFPKIFRLNYTHYFMVETPNKRELQKITNNHSSDIDFKRLMNL